MKKASKTQQWINLAVTLRPLEQLALIGLVKIDPDLTPRDIDVSRIVGEKKCAQAGDWVNKRFREMLQCYCAFCSKISKPVGGGSATTTALIAALATALMKLGDITLVPAVAFAAWALQSGIKLWCDQYGQMQLDGKGEYFINPDIYTDSDLPPNPPQILKGNYSVTFYPAITKVVKDPRYKHPTHRVNIQVPARAEGYFIPSGGSAMAAIAAYCDSEHQHRFSFVDTVTGRGLYGEISVDKLRVSSADHDFAFVAEVVTLGLKEGGQSKPTRMVSKNKGTKKKSGNKKAR
jgi:hypothetical protein